MRKQAKKRPLAPDYKYNNPAVTKLINYIMWDGKKALARKIVYGAFDIIEKKEKKDPMEVFDNALKNVAPALEVKSKRIGGANYQVPQQVKGDRRIQLAVRWIRETSREREGRSMEERLARELIDASNNEGNAVKKKEQIENMARANRAFAHFA